MDGGDAIIIMFRFNSQWDLASRSNVLLYDYFFTACGSPFRDERFGND